MNKHVIVISIDAFSNIDLEYAKTLSAFSKLYNNSAKVEKVFSVFPSLTYPCHASMLTSNYPSKTSIYNNESFNGNIYNNRWHQLISDIKTKTIFDYVGKEFITASVMWPCTGDADINYLIPEIWDNTKEDVFYEAFLKHGSTNFIYNNWHKLKKYHKAFEQPYFDAFVMESAKTIINTQMPNLLYIHLCQIDNAKHFYGLNSTELTNAIHNTNLLLNNLLNELERLKIIDDCTFVICSDHGQIEIKQVSYLNKFLLDNSKLTLCDDKIFSWDIICQSACCSAYIYCKNEKEVEFISALSENKSQLKKLGIKKLHHKTIARDTLNVVGDFDFVVEGESGVFFSSDIEDIYLKNAENTNIKYKCNHGHLPSVGETPVFFMNGKYVNKNTNIKTASIIDEACTIAKIFGVQMNDVDGTVLDKLLCV